LSNDVESKTKLVLVDIFALALIFAEVAIKAASDVRVHGFELLEVIVWQVDIRELWVDEKGSSCTSLYNNG
jgi:hypothetical protein